MLFLLYLNQIQMNMKKILLIMCLFVTHTIFGQRSKIDMKAAHTTVFFYDLDRTDPAIETLFGNVRRLLATVKVLDILPRSSPVAKQFSFVNHSTIYMNNGDYFSHFEKYIISEGPGFICIHQEYAEPFGAAFNASNKTIFAVAMNTFLERFLIGYLLAK